ncbi:Coiled-coil domain-containing protein C6orf97 [Fasciolopsis buskii]|uniref:Coiled-coil domain-containing protein C6orf97 n=1 Tax=Fasciolopsis buskii TaxID=27845 RepID=A0A8E0VKU2_9TREM|nr:Coiled-coil domain-containing protein C6orf97 [Fasciolopsis buski]
MQLNTQTALITKLKNENQELLDKLHFTSGEQKDLTDKFTALKTLSENAEMEKRKVQDNANELKKLLESESKKVKTLEEKITTQAVERERAENEVRKAEKRLEYFVTQMIRILDKYIREDQITSDECKDEKKLAQLLSRASQLVEENVKNRGTIQDLTDRVQNRELQLAERDRTVDRLGSQLTQTAECDRETRNLAQQLEYSRGNECILDRRVRELTENLMNAQGQIRDLENQLTQTKHENQHVYEMRREMSMREGAVFRESLAAILSSSRFPCSPTEVAIKEHARRIVSECAEQRELCARLEARLADATAKMDSLQSLKVNACDEIERVERDNLALRDHIRRIESELASSELTKDGHRADKKRYFLYLCKLASKVKLDQSLAVRMDMNELQEAILARNSLFVSVRVGQLTSGEFTLLTDLQANADRVTGLNRTIKRLQDQLSSKEIQLGMWRNKSSKLEEQVTQLNQQISESHVEKVNAQRFAAAERQVEVENARLRDELHRLRSEMLELTETKTQFLQSEDRMADLIRTNKELEDVRQKQATKITELLKVTNQQAAELNDQQKQSADFVQRLTDDVQSARRTIEQLRRSEKELFEFRGLVARLLGLDADALTVPNYDIVRKLENLIAKLREQHELQCNRLHHVLSDDLDMGTINRSPLRRSAAKQNVPEHGTYMAAPGVAVARSKEARYISGKTDVSLCADSSPNPPDKSVHQMEDGKQQTDQKKFSCTEPGRRDPRRY